MSIVQTLAPLAILIALGAGLAAIRFFDARLLADLNRFVFWVALPALLFRSAADASRPGRATWLLLAVLVVTTLAIALFSWLVCLGLRIPRTSHGTFVQSAFRGNLAYLGLPVLTYALTDLPQDVRAPLLASAVVAMTLTMVLYNVLAVIVLEASRPAPSAARGSMTRSILTNPLLVSGVGGLAVSLLGLTLPAILDRTLDTLGASAVPLALISVGGSLSTARFAGRRSWITIAAALKVVAVPILTWVVGAWVGLGPAERRVALIFAAAPTAAAAYVMASEMDGDETLASGSIALSTLLSIGSLAIVLWASS